MTFNDAAGSCQQDLAVPGSILPSGSGDRRPSLEDAVVCPPSLNQCSIVAVVELWRDERYSNLKIVP
jgi:hypothetical protein